MTQTDISREAVERKAQCIYLACETDGLRWPLVCRCRYPRHQRNGGYWGRWSDALGAVSLFIP